MRKVVMIASLLFVMTASALTAVVDGVTWYYETYSDGTARIVSGSLAYSGSVAVPDYVNGHRVVELDSCFMGCKGLISVTIPDGVVSVGWYGFMGCNNRNYCNL